MKKSNIYIFFFLFILFSCNTVEVKDKIDIFGYTLGDVINNEFKIKEDFDSLPYLNAQYIYDKRVKIRVMDSVISAILFTNMNQTEYQRLLKDVTSDKYGFHKKEEGLPGGLILEGDVSYWINKNTHEKIFLSKRPNEGEFIYSAYYASDSLISKDFNEDYPMIEVTK